MLDKAIRELDRERTGLQQQEKKLIMEIKKMAKEGQMVSWGRTGGRGGGAADPRSARSPPPNTHLSTPQDAVKVMAKSLVRNRHAVNKLFQLKSQLQAVSLRIAVRGWGGAGGGREGGRHRGGWGGGGGGGGGGGRGRVGV